MDTPHIESRLIETPAAGEGADVPRSQPVLIVGRAGRGPTRPVEFESADKAYEMYGTEGELARNIELAIRGAELGATSAGTRALPRVIGLRLPTGAPASATLFADAAETERVMRLETADASSEANDFSISVAERAVTIVRPNGEKTSFYISRNGEATGQADSPLELADAIREAFEDELYVEVETNQARFEIQFDQSAGIVASSSKRSTVLDFTSQDVAALEQLTSGIAVTSIDQVANYDFSDPEAVEIHNRAIPEQINREARFYAITAGKALVAGQGLEQVQVPHLANRNVVGVGGTNSLLNIRVDGSTGPATIEEAAQDPGGTTVSEGYFRAREDFFGRLVATNTETRFVDDTTGEVLDSDPGDGSASEHEFIAFPFDAPNGIADAAGSLADAYASSLGSSYTAQSVDTDRLGEQFASGSDDFLKLSLQQEGVGTSVETITLNLGGTGSSGITADVEWDSTRQKEGTLLLSADQIDAVYDDAYVFLSFDSCIIPMTELDNPSQFTGNGLEFAVDGDVVTFNQQLPHDLVLRGLRVTQYRLGSDINVRRRDGGNVFTITGEGKQPGAGGGPVGDMEVQFGFDFVYAPEWPQMGTVRFDGGSSGANASVEDTIEAMDTALEAYKDQPYSFLVPAGVHLDSVVDDFDPQTGVLSKTNAGLLDVLQRHQERVDAIGASGVAYASVRPMRPANRTGRYTDAQKRDRFEELAQVDPGDDLRPANILSGESYPQMFIFDAPMIVTISGQSFISDGAAMFAGIRSSLTNNSALYQIDIPSFARPLYQYDVGGVNMPAKLAEARINTWNDRRDERRLKDERTAADTVIDSRGRSVPSSWKSGAALLTANEFRQVAVDKLRTLLGPLPDSGPSTARNIAATMLRDAADLVTGVKRLNLDPDRHIRLRADGGNTYRMDIKLFLQVAGEMRVITLEVAGDTEVTGDDAAGDSAIPLAQ